MQKLNVCDFYVNIQIENKRRTNFDVICEQCIYEFRLDLKNRNTDLKDNVHFFLIWWKKNHSNMRIYKSKTSIGSKLGITHSAVIHFIGTNLSEGVRKKSNYFKENNQQISEYLKEKMD